jgi:hypothetical protein
MTSGNQMKIVWANADHTALIVTGDGADKSITPDNTLWVFYSSQEGIEEYYVDPAISAAELSTSVKTKRNQLLSASDWTQTADAPVDKQAWALYRQALRDIPEQSGFPENVVWPTSPDNTEAAQ